MNTDINKQKDDELEHEDRVRNRVVAAISEGRSQLMAVLPFCDGADPRLVAQLLGEHIKGGASVVGSPDAATFREAASDLPWKMPAADPMLGQWWFTLGTIDALTNRIRKALPQKRGKVLCIGAPTIAFHLSKMGLDVLLLDADPDVLTALRSAGGSFETVEHNMFDGLPEKCRNAFDAVVLDPPWYQDEFNVFVDAAMQALRLGGSGYLSIPALLTRPSVVKERRMLLQRLNKLGASIVSLESACLRYVVPEFEQSAYADLDGFTGRPWRASDLVQFHKDEECDPSTITIPTPFKTQRTVILFFVPNESALGHFRLPLVVARSRTLSPFTKRSNRVVALAKGA